MVRINANKRVETTPTTPTPEEESKAFLADPVAKRIAGIAARTLGLMFTLSAALCALSVVPIAFMNPAASVGLLLSALATAVIAQDYLTQGKISDTTLKSFLTLFKGSLSLGSLIVGSAVNWINQSLQTPRATSFS